MKRKRFSVERIVAALKQAEVGVPVTALIRKLKPLQEENVRLKRLVADL